MVGEEQGKRLAAMVANHVHEPAGGPSTAAQIVIVFDKDHWQRFVSIWSRARACMNEMNVSCSYSDKYSDPSGSAIAISSHGPAPVGGSVFAPANELPALMRTRPGELFLRITGKTGEIGEFGFYGGAPRALEQMREAIEKATAYLGSSEDSPSSSPSEH